MGELVASDGVFRDSRSVAGLDPFGNTPHSTGLRSLEPLGVEGALGASCAGNPLLTEEAWQGSEAIEMHSSRSKSEF